MVVRDTSSTSSAGSNSLSGSGVTQSSNKKPRQGNEVKVREPDGTLSVPTTGTGSVTGTPSFRQPIPPVIPEDNGVAVTRPGGAGLAPAPAPAPDGALGTTVVQKPGAGAPGNAPATPLQGTVEVSPPGKPNVSNNFLSIVGGAGGLGRRAKVAKRTLIGGA